MIWGVHLEVFLALAYSLFLMGVPSSWKVWPAVRRNGRKATGTRDSTFFAISTIGSVQGEFERLEPTFFAVAINNLRLAPVP